MTIAARLAYGETLGDRVMKVDHAGEHGAICIYRAQRWMARWRAPGMVAEIDDFLRHERRHRETVVLRHMREQIATLEGVDTQAVTALCESSPTNRHITMRPSRVSDTAQPGRLPQPGDHRPRPRR